jgi:hypothetical protein
MPPDLQGLQRSMEKNNALLQENNSMLRRLSRYQKATFIFTTVWYALLIGLPFALYYYVLGPYVEALGFTSADIKAFPGYGQFETFFGMDRGQ